MKVWTNNQFKGVWPVGTAAVVVANTANEAAELLNAELTARSIHRSATPDQFEELNTTEETVLILNDGDY